MRAINLCNTLVSRGHEVELWSADFCHQTRRFRHRADEPIEVSPGYTLRLLPSSGYRRNIGAARLLDHAVLAYQLHKRLKSNAVAPEVVFIGYPPIETAFTLAGWAHRRGLPCLLDVKDQWPHIFARKIPRILRPLGVALLSPYYAMAHDAMRKATGISAMADGFLEWALDFCRRDRGEFDGVFPLTSPVGAIADTVAAAANEFWDEQGIENRDSASVMFVGSFTSAFDFTPLRDAARAARDDAVPLRFVLCGDGGELPAVKAMMRGLENVVFPGWIDRPRIEALAARSIATIAPYRSTPDFELSIPNKIIDSLGLGLPIISPLRGEVAALIENDGVGLRYDDEAADPGAELYRAIRALIDDETRRRDMSTRASSLYAGRFAFERVYGALADHLELLARQAAGGRSR